MPTQTKPDQIELLNSQIEALDREIAELNGAIANFKLQDEAASRGLEISAPSNSLFDQIASAVERVRLEADIEAAKKHRAELRSATQKLLQEKQSQRLTLVNQREAILVDRGAEAELAAISAMVGEYQQLAERLAELGEDIVNADRTNLRRKSPSAHYISGEPMRLILEGNPTSLVFRYEPIRY